MSGSNKIGTEESFTYYLNASWAYTLELQFYNFGGSSNPVDECSTFNMQIAIAPIPPRAPVCPNGSILHFTHSHIPHAFRTHSTHSLVRPSFSKHLTCIPMHVHTVPTAPVLSNYIHTIFDCTRFVASITLANPNAI